MSPPAEADGITPLGASSTPVGVSNDLSSLQLLRDELAVGRHELSSSFKRSPPHTLGRGKLLARPDGLRNALYHVRNGWACRFRDLVNGRRAIVDIYLPGDVIGLNSIFQTRRSDQLLTLTSIALEMIDGEDALIGLIASRPAALYIAWLLSQQQLRSDRLLSAVQCLDARGRLATMLVDFYRRLRHRRLLTGSIYNLPLTQFQIASYLGLTPVHVNRVLQSFRNERIALMEKYSVTILDYDRLTNYAPQRNGELNSSEESIHNGTVFTPNMDCRSQFAVR